MKDYKKILEGVVNIINAIENSDIGFDTIRAYISENCPELKKSDDERIRKGLIQYFKNFSLDTFAGIKPQEIIAWLEKQGSEPNWCHHKVDLSDCSEEYRKAYYDGWNNCNMQHSQRKSECNDVLKCLINGLNFYYEDNHEATWGTDKWSMPVKHIIEVLESINKEKVDNQNCVNPADKIESKFHEGEWIVDNEEGDFFKVIRVRDNTYRIVSQEGEEFDVQKSVAESYYHKFTINDVKDGDVLISEEGYPFIYASRDIYTKYLTAYCGIDNDGEFISDKNELWANDNVEPATKEQRVTLMKAMADAGFTFDFEKKELEKIENRPLLSDFLNAEYERGKADALKCIRWSEEDEEERKNCIYWLEKARKYFQQDEDLIYINKQELLEAINWLNSLKDRYAKLG